MEALLSGGGLTTGAALFAIAATTAYGIYSCVKISKLTVFSVGSAPNAGEGRRLRIDKSGLASAGVDVARADKCTVLVYFRGTWCKASRTWLRELIDALPDFRQSGIAVHAITSEPGGSTELRDKLYKHGLDATELPVHSDPGLHMCATPFEKLHISKQITSSSAKGDKVYLVVQPAVVVVNKKGQILTSWSWRSITDDENPQDHKMVKVKSFGSPMPLLALHPTAAEIIASIHEDRDICV